MRLVMMGTGTFAEPTFEALLGSPHQVVGLFTQPDRAVGEKRSTTRQTGKGMKEIALERNIPFFQPEKINTPDGLATLTQLQPDLLVVAAYGQILAKDILASARLGGINVHASLLPKYRGAAPIAWAIYHGETETGVTIIHMTPRLDAGDMLAQEAVAIGPNETAGELEARLGPLGARMALEVIGQLETGKTTPIVQNASLVSKAPKLTKEMGQIDWSRSAVQIAHHVRAMQPWPGPHTFLHRPGEAPLRLLLFAVQPAPEMLQHPQPPGTPVKDPTGKRLFVATGDSAWLEIIELQPSGKRRMKAGDFLRGNALPADSLLGPEE